MVQSPTPARAPAYRFTVDDYWAMADAGIFHEDDRVELLAGEVVEMVPIGRRHNSTVDRLTDALASQATGRAITRVQGSIRLDEHSEPQPDVILLRHRDDFYADSDATPADVILIIEVMQTSADYDRTVKVPVYAQAGIPEVWLVDLEANLVEVYRSPEGARYQSRTEHRPGDVLVVPDLSDVNIRLDELLR